jgi:hypothetical protein
MHHIAGRVVFRAVDHVVIRKLEHLTGSSGAPAVSFAVETRDRPGPAHKGGAFEGDVVYTQLHGGLIVARAKVRIGYVMEYSNIQEVRARTRGSALYGVADFWKGRPRYGFAAVAALIEETWVQPPYWGGPRTYGYEWVLLDDDKKRATWLDKREPPRGDSADLPTKFRRWLTATTTAKA